MATNVASLAAAAIRGAHAPRARDRECDFRPGQSRNRGGRPRALVESPEPFGGPSHADAARAEGRPQAPSGGDPPYLFGNHLSAGREEDRAPTVLEDVLWGVAATDDDRLRGGLVIYRRGSRRHQDRNRSGAEGEKAMIGAPLVTSALIGVTLTLAVALVIVYVAGRARAARRHLVLLAAFGVLLFLPLAAVITPTITVPMPVPSTPVLQLAVDATDSVVTSGDADASRTA